MARRILVVDDEAAIRAIVKASLEITAGWMVTTATSGVDGLKIAQRELPDAVLVDVMMPDVDGIAFFEQLRAQALTANIPVIFLTAQSGRREKEKLALLADGVILKPFEPIAIAQKIRSILGWSD